MEFAVILISAIVVISAIVGSTVVVYNVVKTCQEITGYRSGKVRSTPDKEREVQAEYKRADKELHDLKRSYENGGIWLDYRGYQKSKKKCISNNEEKMINLIRD